MNRINKLLERYWQCETSIEEERELQQFFSNGNIPSDLSSYKALFFWKKKAGEIKTTHSFSLSQSKPLRIKLYPILKIAAVALLFLTFGIGIYTQYNQDKKIEQMLSETYSDPHEAVRETQEVVAKVSSLLLLIEENKQNEADSLLIKKEHK